MLECLNNAYIKVHAPRPLQRHCPAVEHPCHEPRARAAPHAADSTAAGRVGQEWEQVGGVPVLGRGLELAAT